MGKAIIYLLFAVIALCVMLTISYVWLRDGLIWESIAAAVVSIAAFGVFLYRLQKSIDDRS